MVTTIEASLFIGKLFGLDERTARQFARPIRVSGFISSGGLGGPVAQATARDAAALMIGMVLAPWASAAGRYVADFGALRLDDTTGKLFDRYEAAPTLLDFLADFLAKLGDPDFAHEMARDAASSQAIWHHPNFWLTVCDSSPSASVAIGEWRATYVHAELAGMSPNASLEELSARVDRREHAVGQYHRGFYSTKTIDAPALIKIADFVNGASFEKLTLAAKRALDQ